MSYEHQLTLQQIDQARGDPYVIADDLEFLKPEFAGLPTRKELARTALAARSRLARPCHLRKCMQPERHVGELN
jgi:hypothetical protein